MKYLKHKIILIVSLLIFASSCDEKKSAENEKLTKLKAEVIHEHDVAMAKMGTLMKLKKELNSRKESTADEGVKVSVDQTISELDEAHEGMMNWMRNFTKKFPAGTLVGGDMNHGDHAKAEESEMMDDQEFYTSLEDELLKIKEIDEEMNQAIQEAESVLKEDNN